jgi:hypothetical protein
VGDVILEMVAQVVFDTLTLTSVWTRGLTWTLVAAVGVDRVRRTPL